MNSLKQTSPLLMSLKLRSIRFLWFLILTGSISTSHALTVTYHGNGYTDGDVAVDDKSYTTGESATVLGNSGKLTSAEMSFQGWNDAAAGTGTRFAPGEKFSMGSADVTLYAQWIYQVDLFDDQATQVWNKENSYEYRVYAPRRDGAYPLFVYTQGTWGSIRVQHIAEILTTMAERGFIAVAVDYGQGEYPSTGEAMLEKAKAVYAEDNPASAVNIVAGSGVSYDGATASFDQGMVVAGFSQGAHMAALAANYHSNVRAAFLIGNGTLLPDILRIENIALEPNQIRSIAGENDEFFGSTLAGVRTQQEATTGWNDPTDSMTDFIQPDGSGWSIAPGTHVFFTDYSGSLFSSFKDGTADWCMNPCFDWLASHAGYLRTTNGSVPHTWLNAQNPTWSSDYETAVATDHDADGHTTLQEYWSGTDPQDMSSFLRISEIQRDATNLVLQWHNAKVDGGLSPLKIEQSLDLSHWETVGEIIPINGINTWANPSTSQVRGFYRIKSTVSP
ncbi:MAG: dienelactone hydrolase [Verrucomicrobiales bacterium]|jgi:dienelactone hydrolase